MIRDIRARAAILTLLACHLGQAQQCRADDYDSSHLVPGPFYDPVLARGRVTEALAKNVNSSLAIQTTEISI